MAPLSAWKLPRCWPPLLSETVPVRTSRFPELLNGMPTTSVVPAVPSLRNVPGLLNTFVPR